MTLPERYYTMQPDPVPGSTIPGLSVWGWMSSDELEWLLGAARRMSSIVEVGSLHGRSATALLTGCKGPVYCIDPWNDEGGHCLPSFMASCGHFPNLRPVQGYSPQVIDEYKIPDVDMVFIDGNHDEASIVADIEAWLPKTRRLICGHDYIENGGYPDVFTVVNRYFAGRIEVPPDTAIWAVNMEKDD